MERYFWNVTVTVREEAPFVTDRKIFLPFSVAVVSIFYSLPSLVSILASIQLKLRGIRGTHSIINHN